MASTTSTGWRSFSPREAWTPEPGDITYGTMSRSGNSPVITADLLLKAYSCGIFPMAESADDDALHWYEPRLRGIMPLDGFHVPTRLGRTIRNTDFSVSADQDFDAVIAACAEAAPGRENTWINRPIRHLYRQLFDRGFCHTIEVRDGRGALVGGLYGVALGGAFFGESMFHRATDASKIALVHLVARLRRGGYQLLDTQFLTEHLKQFGTIEIDKRRYDDLLRQALSQDPDQRTWHIPLSGAEATTLASK
jgi:leucyl/phenylalanyl-tRNA---protein transferase